MLILFIIGSFAQVNAQDTITVGGYHFTNIKKLPVTSVKDQFRSGTCWSFATVSFVESELLRMGRPDLNLSEMFFVREAYQRKATSYVRRQGTSNFSEGGQAHGGNNQPQLTKDDILGKVADVVLALPK